MLPTRVRGLALGAFLLIGCLEPAPRSTIGVEAIEREFPSHCASSECGNLVTLAGVDAFLARVSSTRFGTPSESAGECQPISVDLKVTNAFELDRAQIPIPDACRDSHGCGANPVFKLDPHLRGVECVGSAPAGECTRVRLSATTLRIRVGPRWDGFTTWDPVLELVRPCSQPCEADEVACDFNHTCWEDPAPMCRYCLGGSPDQCACWNGRGYKPIGSECQYAESGDTRVEAHCSKDERCE